MTLKLTDFEIDQISILILIDLRQHGFLEHVLCTNLVRNFIDSLSSSFNGDNNIAGDVVYFDFSKHVENWTAFDSVNHDILINKLKIR